MLISVLQWVDSPKMHVLALASKEMMVTRAFTKSKSRPFSRTGEVITEELVSIEKRTPDHWSDRVSMTAVLFLLLGLWAVTWEAITSLASAALR